ncbi:MAG TPA: EAL domain-containing protein [Pseudolabrys sp.]|nr:EAL domain-containing protein [Pseudolabrys sp.]
MSLLADISPRRALVLLMIAVVLLASGIWMAIRLTTDHLIDSEARSDAQDWALYMAQNVPDLRQIAAGEQPSAASLDFLQKTIRSGPVVRYVIFNRYGYSQFLADHGKAAAVDVSQFSRAAEQAAKTGQTITDRASDEGLAGAGYLVRAFVPVIEQGVVVGTVSASIDENMKLAHIRHVFLVAALSISALTVIAFTLPAVAWYFRTREKQQADRRIRFLAHHDPLTELANRERLIERLNGALMLATPGDRVALHFVDIDRFKEVNDWLGHDGGDFLLKTIAERLSTLTRVDDYVARLGGDEFVVIQPHIEDDSQALGFAERIAALLGQPIPFKEQQIKISVTVGVAIWPSDGTDSERLLKSADIALYCGKNAGRNCIRRFAPEMDAELRQRHKLERIVRDAVIENRLELNFQPVFAMAGKSLIGFEALARLPNPEGGYVPPDVFIPIAEDLRLIDKIGTWVLHEACRTALTWPGDLTVAVNVSPIQFESQSIEKAVADALRDSGLPPHRLELEITETLLLRSDGKAIPVLKRLKAMGVSVVMDDFGTGYSSLSYLWKFPFDKIKIDRSLMASFEKSGRNAEAVVRSIIALGREMNMRVTVEGVETAKQVEFLYDANADQVQGFYFGRPVPAGEIAADLLNRLREQRESASAAPAAQS